MTEERKDQLYNKMFNWICEHISDDEDLFITLHDHFGMTKEELHEHDIEELDAFFPVENTILEEDIELGSSDDAIETTEYIPDEPKYCLRPDQVNRLLEKYGYETMNDDINHSDDNHQYMGM